jgi:hypothetical protein
LLEEVDQLLFGARPVLMDPCCEQALAGAGFPADQHRTVGLCDLPRLRSKVPDHLAGAAKRIDRVARILGPARQIAQPIASVGERSLDHHQQRGELDGLGEEVLGPFLHRANRQVDGTVSSQHEERDRGRSSAVPSVSM